MITLSRDVVQSQILEISKLEISELRLKAQDVSLSDIDDKGRDFINRAIDLRYAELSDICTDGMAVSYEFCEGDLDG